MSNPDRSPWTSDARRWREAGFLFSIGASADRSVLKVKGRPTWRLLIALRLIRLAVGAVALACRLLPRGLGDLGTLTIRIGSDG